MVSMERIALARTEERGRGLFVLSDTTDWRFVSPDVYEDDPAMGATVRKLWREGMTRVYEKEKANAKGNDADDPQKPESMDDFLENGNGAWPLLLVDHPLAIVAAKGQDSCEWCLAPHAAKKCTRCGKRYCSADHQRLDWASGGHQAICQSSSTSSSSAAAPAGKDEDDEQTLLKKMMFLMPASVRQDASAPWQIFASLLPASSLSFSLKSTATQGGRLKKSDVMEKMRRNNPIITDIFLRTIGAGAYPLCSLLNTSCYPNACILFDGKVAHVRAFRHLQQSEEILVSYLDPFATTAERQRTYKERYDFRCRCERCDESGERYALFWRHIETQLSAKCGTVLPPQPPGAVFVKAVLAAIFPAEHYTWQDAARVEDYKISLMDKLPQGFLHRRIYAHFAEQLHKRIVNASIETSLELVPICKYLLAVCAIIYPRMHPQTIEYMKLLMHLLWNASGTDFIDLAEVEWAATWTATMASGTYGKTLGSPILQEAANIMQNIKIEKN